MTVSVDNRTALWGRVGKLFTDEAPASADEAIKAAGLDWDVELRKLAYQNAKGNNVVAPGNFGVVRTDTDELLGTVKGRYKCFNNREAFEFANNIASGGGIFESGFSLGGGKTVGLTMSLPDTITVGGEDPHKMYLALRTTHNGTGAITVAISTMRLACLNAFDAAIRGARSKYTVRHTAKAGAQLQQAREALEIAFVYGEQFETEMEKLMNTSLGSVSADSTRIMLSEIIADQPYVSEKVCEKHVGEILANLATSGTIADEHRNTGYGLVNATSEYWQHLRQYRTPEAGFRVNTEGIGHRVVGRVHNELISA